MLFVSGIFLMVQLAGPAVLPSVTVSPSSGFPCPIAPWGGYCNYLTTNQREQIKRMVDAYIVRSRPACERARATLVSWLGDQRQAWVFEVHAGDDARTGTYVLGQTAGRPAAGFGLRLALFISVNREALARVSLHEAVHLAGGSEVEAGWVERDCISTSAITAAIPDLLTPVNSPVASIIRPRTGPQSR